MDQLDGGFAVWIQEMVNLLCQTIFFSPSRVRSTSACTVLHDPFWGAKFAVTNQRSGGFAMTD